MTTPRAHTLPSDPLIEEVRQRRQELRAPCDNDLGKLAELIRRREADRPDGCAWATPISGSPGT